MGAGSQVLGPRRPQLSCRVPRVAEDRASFLCGLAVHPPWQEARARPGCWYLLSQGLQHRGGRRELAVKAEKGQPCSSSSSLEMTPSPVALV